MIDRIKLAKELKLREHIRSAIKVVKNKRDQIMLQESKQEVALREIVRELIAEGQSAVAAVAKHDSTGINALEDLLRNTNVLSVLETGYKSLTTDKNQRESYRNHVLAAVEGSLAPEESRKSAGEDVEITEDIDIGVGDRPEDDPDFIDVEDDGTEPEVEVDEKEEFGLNGEDKTGRNRAFTDFQNIEKVILTAFDDLDNPEDMTMFEEYLIKNLSLYFDKFEGELDVNVSPPAVAADAVPDAGDLGTEPDDSGADEETNIPEFALEEVMKHLNLDDIIENLL
jgi:hypothetical protein